VFFKPYNNNNNNLYIFQGVSGWSVVKREWGRWNRRICRFPVVISPYVSEITSALSAHYDHTPFWISAVTNKDDLEWSCITDST